MGSIELRIWFEVRESPTTVQRRFRFQVQKSRFRKEKWQWRSNRRRHIELRSMGWTVGQIRAIRRIKKTTPVGRTSRQWRPTWRYSFANGSIRWNLAWWPYTAGTVIIFFLFKRRQCSLVPTLNWVHHTSERFRPGLPFTLPSEKRRWKTIQLQCSYIM